MPGRPPLGPACALAVLLAGCSSGDLPPLAVPAGPGPQQTLVPTAAADVTAAQCAGLLDRLPGQIDPGVVRRAVRGDPRAAAWGDPPVVLRCGAEAVFDDGASVGVNGLDWVVTDIGPGFRWTTLGRAVPVSVEIPESYANGAELVNPLGAPILAAIDPAPEASPPT